MFVNACFSRSGTELIHFNAMDSNTMPKGNREGPVLDYLMARLLFFEGAKLLTLMYGSYSVPHTSQTADRWALAVEAARDSSALNLGKDKYFVVRDISFDIKFLNFSFLVEKSDLVSNSIL